MVAKLEERLGRPIADYFDLDPTLVRLFFVLAFLLGGHGVLVYLALWIVVPDEPAGQAVISQAPHLEESGSSAEA